MSRSSWNFLVDSCLLCVLCCVLWVSFVLYFVFPQGTEAAGWRLWGWGYDAWSRVQICLLGLFAVNVLVHLILHWTWVIGYVSARLSKLLGHTVRPHESAKTIYGVSTLIAVLTLLGLLVLIADFAIKPPKTADNAANRVSARNSVEECNAGRPSTTNRMRSL